MSKIVTDKIKLKKPITDLPKNKSEERLKRGIPYTPYEAYGDDWNNWYDLVDKPRRK